ncbi:hypothetical protein [Aequorivita echinoideorum]|uniref:hypothetical protein n=1 Tax=Aequorivita echinoideorum TaxID=1549647 RepID=UPI001FE7B532|nr:hypothetical protein [Aequorivita echinoideorum]
MKTLLKTALIIFSIQTLTISCQGDDDSNSQQDAPLQQNIEIVQNGNWRITYYFDTDQEETNHFTGYIFTFNSNNSLVAVKGDNSVTGTWSITNGSSSDDDGGSSNDTDFNIFFSSPADFEELSDDWDIISISNSKIELTDVSGGNGGTDFLTFEKI